MAKLRFLISRFLLYISDLNKIPPLLIAFSSKKTSFYQRNDTDFSPKPNRESIKTISSRKILSETTHFITKQHQIQLKKPAPFLISDSQARFQHRNRSEHSKPHISTRRRSEQAKNRLPEPVPCPRSRSSSRNLKEKRGDRIRNLAFLREIGENDSDRELQSGRSRRSP